MNFYFSLVVTFLFANGENWNKIPPIKKLANTHKILVSCSENIAPDLNFSVKITF